MIDLLVSEGAPEEVIKVARRHGQWRGSRDEWEQQGPIVVDAVPIHEVWIIDAAPYKRGDVDGPIVFRWYVCGDAYSDAEDISSRWASGHRGTCVLFPTAHEAQVWLTRKALEYARRRRAELFPCEGVCFDLKLSETASL